MRFRHSAKIVGRCVCLPVIAVAAFATLAPDVSAKESAELTTGSAEFSAEQIAFFETKIRPILAEHCYSCHSAESEVLQGGLFVDSREGLVHGGDSGPAVIPGEAEDSLLLQSIRYEAYEMPPGGKLPDHVIADFEKWIAMGLPDPRHGGPAVERPSIDVEKGREFWSFRPVETPAVPTVQHVDWPLGDVDHFLLAELETRGLSPAADTDRGTWLRRVTFDLIGLPPTLEEIDDFAQDASADAHARVVSRLLASPHFGERWGRHWLDVARFAESSGGGRTLVFKDAWRYRDYVIDSVNRDKPIDRFIVEQIAGDLLPHSTVAEESEHIIATAYLVLGAHNYEEQDKQQLEMDVVDEQLDAIGRGLLGMTIACARCHDHKFDPIPTTDYYALAGILRSTHVLEHENVSQWTARKLPMLTDKELAAVEAYDAELIDVERRLAEANTRADDAGKKAANALSKKLDQLRKSAPQHPTAMAVSDASKIEDCQVCIRGSVRHRGPMVPRGVLQVATLGETPTMPADRSGRRELAEWITSASNPLTARVYVNRVWQYLFGAGLVRTADNFGSTGEAPSHPELLDYLASRFMRDGWSTKRLVRELALSRAYRMSTTDNAKAAGIDPENRLLWRMNRRRLDAESLRDAMLAVSGRLDARIGGPNILDQKVIQQQRADMPTEYSYVFADMRRSVYTPAFRNRIHELFEVFDFANQNSAVATRNVTTVAPQALLMLNSTFVMEQARAAAERALAAKEITDEKRIQRAFVEAFGRAPSPAEHEIALASLNNATTDKARLAAWEQLFQALFGCIDFRYVE